MYISARGIELREVGVKNTYWAKAPLAREQIVLFPTKLDEVISDNHPARVYAELIEGYDWSEWEATYHGWRGQPPIHPRILATLWLYGIRRGIRTSRRLEYMAANCLDFMWLAEGHRPDHTTFSEFRSRFKQPLKHLFKSIIRIALTAGLARLAGVASDGTHIQANASRFETWTQTKIDIEIKKLVDEFARRIEEPTPGEALDETLPEPGQGELFEELGGDSNLCLPPELADQHARIQKLREIQQQLQDADAARKKEGTDPLKNPAQIPVNDLDSRIMPNKDGGYAPNYTPYATTESHGGFILEADVVSSVSDSATLLPSLDRIKDDHGEYPDLALADGAYASGPNLSGMQERGIEFLTNIKMPDPATNPATNSAIRPDVSVPVAEEFWIALPLSPQTKKLDKACFVYAEDLDRYVCPMGQVLEYAEKKSDVRHGEKREWRVYRCDACGTCPLREKCVSAKSKSGRTVTRDVYTKIREEMAFKMTDPDQKKRYDQRMRIAEAPFALIKHVIGLRQFLLRGQEKVETEWQWTCLALNLDKLVRGVLKMRTAFAAMIGN